MEEQEKNLMKNFKIVANNGTFVFEIVDSEARESIGNTEKLETTAKQDLVAAINEIARGVADIKYVPIEISSISKIGTVEKGITVKSVMVQWALNKNPASQTVNGAAVAATARSKSFDGLSITKDTPAEDRTFTVTATDERGKTVSKSTSIAFCNGVYYGVLEDGTEINSKAIRSLNKKLQSTRGLTFTANAGATQRIVYAIPANGYGTPKFKDKDTQLGADFYQIDPIDFTNAHEYEEKYNVWLSTNLGLGSITVEVS